MSTLKAICSTAVMFLLFAGSADATPLTCPTSGSFNRQVTVNDAIGCQFAGPVTGTPGASDVGALFGGTWTGEGILHGDGTNDWLSADVTAGSWGTLPVSGTWGIDPAFWTTYQRAILTFHLGNGGGDPDWFFFEIGSNQTSGTFNVVKLSGVGGGFSNVALWGFGTTTLEECTTCSVPVPEPGTLVMLGLGLTGIATVLRRRHSARKR